MKCTVGWAGCKAVAYFYFNTREAQAKEQGYSIKGVTLDTVKIKHNSYENIIRDKIMYKI